MKFKKLRILLKFSRIKILIVTCIMMQGSVFAEHFFNLEYIGSEQGLEDSSIEKIVQDQDGYIWIGTQAGLYKYDGKKAKKYTNDGEPGSLLSADIYDIMITKENVIWVATSTGGLGIYNRKNDGFENISQDTLPSIKHYKVTKLIEYDEKIWVINELGIERIDKDGGAVESLKFINNLSENQETYTARNFVIYKNELLTLIDNKIFKYDSEKEAFVEFEFQNEHKNKYSENFFHYGIFSNAYNEFYIHTDRGVFFVDSSSNAINKEPIVTEVTKQDRLRIRDVLRDSHGTTWVVTNGQGVLYKLPFSREYKKIEIGGGKNQLNTDQVYSIFEDRTRNIWLGTDGFYTAKYRAPQVVFPFYSNFYSLNRSVHTNAIWTFEEFNNDVFIGSDNGIFQVIDTNKGSILDPILNSEKFRVVYDLLVVKDEMIIGGLNGLFSMLGDGSIKDLNYKLRDAGFKSTRPDNTVTQLSQSDSHLFVGTFNGLIALNKINDTSRYYNSYGTDYRIHNGAIMSLGYDSVKNILWVGTETGVEVISIEENSKISKINETLKTIDGFINDIHIEQNGSVWIAVNTTLYRYTPEGILIEYTHFPENEIRAIETVGDTLWMTTATGMLKTTTDNLENYKYYIYEDGIYNKGNSTMASYYSKKNDELMFGGDVGFIKFKSNFDIPIKQNIAPQMNVVNLLNIDNQPDILDRLETTGELEHYENNLRFEYAYLDYKAPKKNRFQIKLEGFDNSWSQLTKKNEATYTNLKSGDYVFRVKAFDANNVLSDRELSIYFTINKAWWKSDLAYLVYFLCLLSIGFFIASWVKNEQKRQKKLQLQKNKEEFINGYNRYALSLTELKSHQTLVRKFLDQVRLITDIEYVYFEQLLNNSVLEISVGEYDGTIKSLSVHELVGNSSTAQMKIKNKDASSFTKLRADIQILFQQMEILQNALIDRQKYNRNDYFSSLTGHYEKAAFKNIIIDEFKRASIHNAEMTFFEWHILKSQFKENELLKRIQLLSYGDQISSIFGNHLLATYSETRDSHGKFIIFLGEEHAYRLKKFKEKLESIILDNLKGFSVVKENQQYLKIISVKGNYEEYLQSF